MFSGVQRTRVYRSSGRRAVPSHSKKGPKNSDAFSRHIQDEAKMHHLVRKGIILPCGYTVRESWAALRRSWQGFKIAHGKGDVDKMRHYACFIHKVQLELGVGLTVFEPGLVKDWLDETAQVSSTDISECQFPSNMHSSDQINDDSLPDYDEMMGDIALPPNIPEPSDNIFVRRIEKSCPVESFAPKPIVQKRTTYYEKSCPAGPQNIDVQTKVRVTKHTINYQDSCPVESTPDSQADDELFEENEPGYEEESPGDPEDSNDIFSNWRQSHIVHQDSSCLYEPPDEKPSHIVHQDSSCLYEPPDEKPSHIAHEDSSCLYEPSEQDRKRLNNERDVERKRKSNFYKTEN